MKDNVWKVRQRDRWYFTNDHTCICQDTNVSAEGQTVQVSGSSHVCQEEDVINPALDKLENPTSKELNIQLRFDVLRRRTDWVSSAT